MAAPAIGLYGEAGNTTFRFGVGYGADEVYDLTGTNRIILEHRNRPGAREALPQLHGGLAAGRTRDGGQSGAGDR